MNTFTLIQKAWSEKKEENETHEFDVVVSNDDDVGS